MLLAWVRALSRVSLRGKSISPKIWTMPFPGSLLSHRSHISPEGNTTVGNFCPFVQSCLNSRASRSPSRKNSPEIGCWSNGDGSPFSIQPIQKYEHISPGLLSRSTCTDCDNKKRLIDTIGFGPCAERVETASDFFTCART